MEINSNLLQSHLKTLVGPRHMGDEEAEKRLKATINYISDTLEEIGFEVRKQNFEIDSMKTAWGRSVSNYSGTNIIAELEGSLDEVLIIATHHDTVPKSPGADDNATGVAALLEIAKYLVTVSTDYTIRLISFDLEESGLLGSEWYVQHIEKEEKENIRGMIMLEMLGYFTDKKQGLPGGFGMIYRKEINRLKEKGDELKGNFLACVYREDAQFIANAFDDTQTDENMKVGLIRDAMDLPWIGGLLDKFIPSLQNLLRSDHTPFWYRQIPAVMITDTANFRNPHYHKPSDKIETINLEEFTRACQRVLDAIVEILKNK